LPASAKNLVYKHGIELTVEGAYLDLLRYQERLEKLPWHMFFARTSVDSSDYPKVRMTITLYTLSLEEAWLVV
jgi:MSHA biogenesis protein MshJ